MQDLWVKATNNAWFRLGAYRAIYVSGSGSAWHLWLDLNDGTAQTELSGEWTTETAAADAARRLVEGVDPGTY